METVWVALQVSVLVGVGLRDAVDVWLATRDAVWVQLEREADREMVEDQVREAEGVGLTLREKEAVLVPAVLGVEVGEYEGEAGE